MGHPIPRLMRRCDRKFVNKTTGGASHALCNDSRFSVAVDQAGMVSEHTRSNVTEVVYGGSNEEHKRSSNTCLGFSPDVEKLCAEGRLDEALQVVVLMKNTGNCVPIDILFTILQGCIRDKDLVTGRKLYALITACDFGTDSFLGTHLIRMFALCGSLAEAQEVFNKLSEPTVFVWAAIILAHANLGHAQEAIALYHQMYMSGIRLNGHIFVSVLKACSVITALEEGKLIHANIVEKGFDSNLHVGNTLINMYAKSGSLQDCYWLFERLPKQDLVTWSAIISAYAQHGYAFEALRHFHLMRQKGLKPDSVIFVSVLKACSIVGDLDQGKVMHKLIAESGLKPDVFVESALIDMYTNCGSIDQACRVFEELPRRSSVTWNAIISAHLQHGHGHEAFELYEEMKEQGVEPDLVTFLVIAKAGSSLRVLNKAKCVHADIVRSGYDTNVLIGNTLIDMYAKCGSLDDAHEIFKRVPKPTVVTWNAMIAAYVLHGQEEEALQLYKNMQTEPDIVSFVSLLKACSSFAALEQGKLIHGNIIEFGYEHDTWVGNALLDMYAKCASIVDGSLVFDKLPQKDVITWTAVLDGFARNCKYNLTWQYFEEMQHQGLKPNEVTCLILLTICSSLGLVADGCMLFKSMIEVYDINPTLDHYSCIVDLLGHVGHVGEAEYLLQTMPFDPNFVGWTALLAHCDSQCNTTVGRECFEHFHRLGSSESSGYVIMSKIYSIAGMLADMGRVQDLRRSVHVWKKPGKSSVEVGYKVHDFVVGDQSHTNSNGIFAKMRRTSVEMRVVGYMPFLELAQLALSGDSVSALERA